MSRSRAGAAFTSAFPAAARQVIVRTEVTSVSTCCASRLADCWHSAWPHESLHVLADVIGPPVQGPPFHGTPVVRLGMPPGMKKPQVTASESWG